MIVILCSSWKKACTAFQRFLKFLQESEPWTIVMVNNPLKCIKTDDDLYYIFVDYRMDFVFQKISPDIVDVEEFFEGINEYYHLDVFGEEINARDL